MLLLVGILAALWSGRAPAAGPGRRCGGMVDESSVLIQMMWAMRATAWWTEGQHARRWGTLTTPTNAPTAATPLSAPLERSSMRAMLAGLGLDAVPFRKNDRARWPELRALLDQRSRATTVTIGAHLMPV